MRREPGAVEDMSEGVEEEEEEEESSPLSGLELERAVELSTAGGGTVHDTRVHAPQKQVLLQLRDWRDEECGGEHRQRAGERAEQTEKGGESRDRERNEDRVYERGTKNNGESRREGCVFHWHTARICAVCLDSDSYP